MHKFIGSIIVASIFLLATMPVSANGLLVAEASAHPSYPLENKDQRIIKLKAYLETHNSPLADSAGHFIAEADRLNMDWKLVVAIAGVESTFGKHIPANSYNGWGWAIFTGQNDGKHFADWNDGITTVSEGLRYKYMDKGLTTLDQIGRRYAASPAWSGKVNFFIQKIENFDPTGINHLAVTI